MYNGRPLRPGELEIYCGPMGSGKSLALIHRVQVLQYPHPKNNFIFLKPQIDNRDEKIRSRGHNAQYDCVKVDESNPYEILKIVEQKHKLVLLDELQFFGKGIEEVVLHMQRQGKNVVGGGLDLDFRAEPFGRMHNLMAMADEVTKLRGIGCAYQRCSRLATRTQRLVDGEPAHYTDPIILVGDKEEGYEARCVKHHIVPGKPGIRK